jgi:Sir2 family
LPGLPDSGIDTTVVTQNTDGLHQRAGTPADRVIELHGTMHVVVCTGCGYRSPTTDVLARIGAGEPTPPCPRCGGILKTASTMFGQTMSPEVFSRAERAVTTCDLVLAVGTTLTVEPAGSLCASAVRAGASLVIVNLGRTSYDSIATEIIREPLGEALPRIASQLRAARHSARPVADVARRVADDARPRAAAPAGLPEDMPIRHEPAHLRDAAGEHGLELPADVLDGAVVTAVLGGAADEEAALGVLGHIPALKDAGLRLRVARWLREVHPPGASSSYWAEALPDPLAEDLIAAVVSPRFLVGMLMETTEEQDRRALTVLARAAATRPALHACLTELLSVLPGISPAAVDAALHGGYPAPLADALTSLARNAALPAELLEAVPAGTTVLGEFPVLLAESLVEAYEHRLATHPKSAPRGLATMLTELAERLADLGRAEEALASARRAVETAERLPGQPGLLARAATSLSRASGLSTRDSRDDPPGDGNSTTG